MTKALEQIAQITEALNNFYLGCQYVADGLNTLVKRLDTLTKKHAGYVSFATLIHARDFCPTFPKKPSHPISAHYEQEYAELDLLALCYDMAQEARGDSRRAFRS